MSVQGLGHLVRRLERLEGAQGAPAALVVSECHRDKNALYALPDGQEMTLQEVQDYMRRRNLGVLVIDDLPRQNDGETDTKGGEVNG